MIEWNLYDFFWIKRDCFYERIKLIDRDMLRYDRLSLARYMNHTLLFYSKDTDSVQTIIQRKRERESQSMLSREIDQILDK